MSDKNFDKIYGMLLYVSVQAPVKAYVKAGAPPKSDEWKASVVLTDEDYVDALEEYAKELDTQISLKKVKTSDFEAMYKVAPPEDAGSKVWVLTLRKSTMLGKTEKPVPDLYKPKVFEKQGGRLVDITQSKLVGNGSLGALSVDRFDRTKGGSSLYLKNVLVTDLKEYVKQESDYESGSEFEDEVSDGDGGSQPIPKAAKDKAAEKPAKAAKAKPAEDDSDPF